MENRHPTPDFTAADLPVPAPFDDVTNTAALLSLPDIAPLAGEDTVSLFDDHSSEVHRAITNRRRYRTWRSEARVLARAGVVPAPSHVRHGAHQYVSLNGGFADASVLQHDRVAAGLAHPNDPLIFFGYRLADGTPWSPPPLPLGYPWHAITTQSGGVACHHPRFVGVLLDPAPAALGALYRVASFAHDNARCCIGGNLRLSDLADYRDELTSQGLSCEGPYEWLEEAVYPLDRTCAPALSDTPCPSDDEIWPAPDPELAPLDQLLLLSDHDVTRWGVWVLGANCD